MILWSCCTRIKHTNGDEATVRAIYVSLSPVFHISASLFLYHLIFLFNSQFLGCIWHCFFPLAKGQAHKALLGGWVHCTRWKTGRQEKKIWNCWRYLDGNFPPKIYVVALNIGFEGISSLAVRKGAYSWEELVLLEALWEKFTFMHLLHYTGDVDLPH